MPPTTTALQQRVQTEERKRLDGDNGLGILVKPGG